MSPAFGFGRCVTDTATATATATATVAVQFVNLINCQLCVATDYGLQTLLLYLICVSECPAFVICAKYAAFFCFVVVCAWQT